MTKILYFAWVRERIGKSEEDLALPAHLDTVGDLLEWLSTRSPGHAAALGDRDAVRVGVDQDHARPDASIVGAREIAIFPPVTGGQC
jgi:molybdopterin synthase sulfur carrier subunit